jgi:hypothetical protein
MEKVKPNICYHPELRPTDWNQPKPEPCEMLVTCECGANQMCPVCGYGFGSYPCPCTREHAKENPVFQIIPNENNKITCNSNNYEVTHEVFFGENIKRVKNLFNKK